MSYVDVLKAKLVRQMDERQRKESSIETLGGKHVSERRS
jgi:hypothetical protein